MANFLFSLTTPEQGEINTFYMSWHKSAHHFYLWTRTRSLDFWFSTFDFYFCKWHFSFLSIIRVNPYVCTGTGRYLNVDNRWIECTENLTYQEVNKSLKEMKYFPIIWSTECQTKKIIYNWICIENYVER